MRNLKSKKYSFWRLDTYFNENKLTNLEIIKDGGWHFTNIKTPEELYIKMTNFGHHNEFELSGLTVEDLRKKIDEGVVFYNHFSDQTDQNKWNYDYKLKKINIDLLPKYLQDNSEKFKEWFK